MIRPTIVITHAAFDEHRRRSLARLLSQLSTEAPGINGRVVCDNERNGSLWCWKRAMERGLADDEASHIVWLPDDAIVCQDFGAVLLACINARPHDVFDGYVNHGLGDSVTTCWYTTPDGGFTGMAGVFPRERLVEHLMWREAMSLPEDYSNDGGVNLWAMHSGRKIYKTAWTIAQHDDTMPSIDGNESHAYRTGKRFLDEHRSGVNFEIGNFLGRTFSAPQQHLPGHATSVTELPNTYEGNHWSLVKAIPPRHWNLETMYTVARHGEPVETPSVYILCPTYRMPQEFIEKTRASVQAVRDHLGKHDIKTGYLELRGDALVCRMRQRGVNVMLQSPCSHLLWWDADIECLTPECVKAMLDSGHDIIAGCVPFKNDSHEVVCNLFAHDVAALRRGDGITVEGGCLPVLDAGSGFMLVSRDALCRMQKHYPELLHFSASKADFGEPLWALFDTAVVDRIYRSEDYYFCHLWRQMGQSIYVYEPARFKHWGVHGFTGSLREQYNLDVAHNPGSR